MREYSALIGAFALATLLMTSVTASPQVELEAPAPPAPEDALATAQEALEPEIGAWFWSPTLSPVIQANSFGVTGTSINLANDVGLVNDESFPGFVASIKIPGGHSFSLDYFEYAYTGSATLGSEVVFNGVRHPRASVATTNLDIVSMTGAYEYAFDRNSKGYLAGRVALMYITIDTQVVTDQTPANGFGRTLALPGVGFAFNLALTDSIAIDTQLTALPFTKSNYYDYSLSLIFNITEGVTGVAGWKYLSIKDETPDSMLDLTFSGPLITLSISLGGE